MYRFKRLIQVLIVFALTLFTVFPMQVNAEAEEQGLHYVALGDSLAAGLSYESYGKNRIYIKSYPEFIAEGIKRETELEVTLTNRGIPGFTTVDLLDQLTESEVQQNLAAADLITIDIGANDLLGAVGDISEIDPANEEDMRGLYEAASEAITLVGNNLGVILHQVRAINPDAPIYVMGYYNAMPYLAGLQEQVEELMGQLNYAISLAAQSIEAPFVPTYAAFEGNYETYLPNPENIHPSEEGYRVIGELFLEQIIPALVVEDEPDPDVPQVWAFGEGEPSAETEATLYADLLDATVYQLTEEAWLEIGNLFAPAGLEDALWLYAAGAPSNEIGNPGELYADLENEAIYFYGDDGWSLVHQFTEPEPEPVPEEPEVRWLIGHETPEDGVGKEGELYLEIETANVYEYRDGVWVLIGNLGEHTDDAPWLAGDGAPVSELGRIGELYVDNAAGTVYIKQDTGWVPVGELSEEEPEVPADPPTEPAPEEEDPPREEKEDDDRDTTPPAAKGDNGSKGGADAGSKSGGKELPSTATNMYLYMTLGILLLLAGTAGLAMRKVKGAERAFVNR